MSFQTKSNRIVVVGIIGKSRNGKALVLNEIIDVPLFKPLNPSQKTTKSKVKYDKDKETAPEFLRIESHLDSENNILYLNLVSIHDSNALFHMINHFDIENMSSQEFHLWLENEDYRHMKALLFMFHVCHIILISHPGSTFDVEYLKILRVLQTFKQMLAPTILSHFSNSPHQYISDFKAASSLTPGKCVPLISFIFSPKISKTQCKVYPIQQRMPSLQFQQPPVPVVHQSLHNSLQQSLISPSDSQDNEKDDILLQPPQTSPSSSSSSSSTPAILPFSQKAPVLLQKQPQILQQQQQQPPQPQQSVQQQTQILAREDKYKDVDPMRKLEASLESQIKLLLKKAKLYIEHNQVSSVNGLPLFSIEPSFGLVRVVSPTETTADLFSIFSNAISSLTVPSSIPLSPSSPPFPRPSSSRSIESSSANSNEERTVSQLVTQQVKMLLGPPGPPGKRTEYITIRVWQTAANTLQELLLNGPPPRSRGPPQQNVNVKTIVRSDPAEKLLTFLDPDYKFSASKCVAALPGAREQYLQGLPAHYTSQVHEKQLQKANTYFSQLARGPAAPYYLSKLRDECTKVWVGRQICDAVSLTGRPCVYLVESSGNAHNGPHSSGYQTISACSCGSSRHSREDPFDIESANHSFYSSNFTCCESMISLDITLASPQWSLMCLGNGSYYQPTLGMQQDGFVQNRNFLSLVHFGGAPWLMTSKMGLGNVIRHSRQLRNEHHHHPNENVISPQNNVAYIGYEYECPSGHRFFMEPPKEVNVGGVLNLSNANISDSIHPNKANPHKSRSRGSRHRHKQQQHNVGETATVPIPVEEQQKIKEREENRNLFINCVACNSIAQLQRIFIVTPDWPGSFSIHPKVIFVSAPPPPQPQTRPGMPPIQAPPPPEKYEFSLGMVVALPKNACLCLRLPYIYSKPGSGNGKQIPLLQTAPNQPYIATATLGLHIPHLHAHPQPREG